MKEPRERDHAFVIDDSASMAPAWPDVQRVFKALSYVVRDMSPEETELFFTVVYHTYRRKDSSELCTHLSTHTLKGQTFILYRLNLRLQAYRLELLHAKSPLRTKSKKPPSQPFVPAKVRPLSMYILSNGEWDSVAGGSVEGIREMMRVMGEFLKSEGLGERSVSVQVVSFGGSAGAMGRMGALSREGVVMRGVVVS